MNTIVDQMLKRYDAKTLYDQKNAVKEVMQEIVLCGLSRAGFFQESSFLWRNSASHFLWIGSFFRRFGLFPYEVRCRFRYYRLFS